MKLRDLIANLDLSLELKTSDFYEISRLLFPDYIEHGYDYSKWEQRFGCLYLKERICTDTTVGVAVHMLDKRPVLLSEREGRGTSTDYRVIDPTLLDDLKAFVKECDYTKPTEPELRAADLDQELGDGYTPEYSFDLRKNQRVRYQDRWVIIAEDSRRFNNNISSYETVDITFGGDVVTVSIDDIEVPWLSQKETA